MNNRVPPSLIQICMKYWLINRHADDLRSPFSLGPGDLHLLQSLHHTLNLTQSCHELKYSYKYAWQKLRKMANLAGQPVVVSTKGGSGGGGRVILTQWGEYLVQVYEFIQKKQDAFLSDLNQALAEIPFVTESP